jgi:hypothetical protein
MIDVCAWTPVTMAALGTVARPFYIGKRRKPNTPGNYVTMLLVRVVPSVVVAGACLGGGEAMTDRTNNPLGVCASCRWEYHLDVPDKPQQSVVSVCTYPTGGLTFAWQVTPLIASGAMPVCRYTTSCPCWVSKP